MDYETLGEHQWEDTGIFNFMQHLPSEILKHPDNDFKTPSEAAAAYDPVGVFDVPHTISWADIERDLSAWLGNPMQENALAALYRLEHEVKSTNDRGIIVDWRKLQASDHFYYMCTKYFADGDVHKYFNPYDSPYDAYINFMNVLDNLRSRCLKALPQKEHALLDIPVLEVPLKKCRERIRKTELFRREQERYRPGSGKGSASSEHDRQMKHDEPASQI